MVYVHIGLPPMSSTGIISITVTDVNDNPPQFTKSRDSITFQQTQLAIGQILYTVTATDADEWMNAEVTYTLGTAGAWISIDSYSGALSLVTVPRQGTYSMTVHAQDGGLPLQTSMFTLEIIIELPKTTTLNPATTGRLCFL